MKSIMEKINIQAELTSASARNEAVAAVASPGGTGSKSTGIRKGQGRPCARSKRRGYRSPALSQGVVIKVFQLQEKHLKR